MEWQNGYWYVFNMENYCAGKIYERVALILGARLAQFHQQLLNGCAMHAGHARHSA
jgi:hypothetical protein